MAKSIMTVVVPDIDVFNAYDYGYGEMLECTNLPDGRLEVIVDYGDDSYRAKYQAGRFASGLYFAKVVEV